MPMAQEIGLGPALFLMYTKKMGILFFVISIIQLPVMMCFWQANTQGTAMPNTEGASPEDGSFFARLTLGNIGQDPLACGEKSYGPEVRVNQNATIDLSCPNATLG